VLIVRHRVWILMTGFFLASKQYLFDFFFSSFVDRLVHRNGSIPAARTLLDWRSGDTDITVYLLTLIALLSRQFCNIKTNRAFAWIDEFFVLTLHYLIWIKVMILQFLDKVKPNHLSQSILAKLLSLFSYLWSYFFASLIQIKMLLLQVGQC
jgi:hypothetical protein